jgi:hypothetical protein
VKREITKFSVNLRLEDIQERFRIEAKGSLTQPFSKRRFERFCISPGQSVSQLGLGQESAIQNLGCRATAVASLSLFRSSTLRHAIARIATVKAGLDKE